MLSQYMSASFLLFLFVLFFFTKNTHQRFQRFAVWYLHFSTQSNRPFPSSPAPLYQNEVNCSAFDMEIIFHSHANKTHFHKKGCALRLILKVRVFGTRKWPIVISFNEHSGMFPLNCGLHWLILLIPWKDCKYIHSRIWFDHFLLNF